MPIRACGYEKLENAPLGERKAMEHQFQKHWYDFIAPVCAGLAVIDVGSGTGYGLPILEAHQCNAFGIDICECELPVHRMGIKNIPDLAWHWALAIDVIEHVEEDREFLRDLLRVAINNVFFTTPNWNKFHAGNKYHVREYTPTELLDMLSGLNYKIYMSDYTLKIVEVPNLEPDNKIDNFGVLITK